MKLLTKEIEKNLPSMYETEGIPIEDKIVRVKFFTPWGNTTWYVVEYDSNTKEFFGYVQTNPLDSEWGYFSLIELENLRGPFGLKVERDMHFDPKKFGDIDLITHC